MGVCVGYNLICNAAWKGGEGGGGLPLALQISVEGECELWKVEKVRHMTAIYGKNINSLYS